MLERRKFDSPEIEKTVDRQLRNWEMRRTQRLQTDKPCRPEVEDFIAISRQVGAGASEIAAALATRLKWPRLDREVLQAMAGHDATRHRIYESLDEHDLGWWEEAFRATMDPEFVRNDYFRRLVKTTLSLARQGSAIFVGRGVDFMLPPNLGFRVRIVAPIAMRLQRFADRHGVTLTEAGDLATRIDREREEFVRHRFRVDVNDPTRCDLTLNMQHFSVDQAVEAILAVRAAMKGSASEVK
ncbi:MAG: cytidylate kinase-like family protein [Phycisphaerae bacterium]